MRSLILLTTTHSSYRIECIRCFERHCIVCHSTRSMLYALSMLAPVRRNWAKVKTAPYIITDEMDEIVSAVSERHLSTSSTIMYKSRPSS